MLPCRRIPGAHHLGTSYPELDLAVLGLCDHSIIDFGTFGIWVCTCVHSCFKLYSCAEQHELILCVSEGFLSQLLCIHIVDMGTFGLHALILCVSEGILCELLCIHIVDIEAFVLHGQLLSVS